MWLMQGSQKTLASHAAQENTKRIPRGFLEGEANAPLGDGQRKHFLPSDRHLPSLGPTWAHPRHY